jgi:hypothetical protein
VAACKHAILHDGALAVDDETCSCHQRCAGRLLKIDKASTRLQLAMRMRHRTGNGPTRTRWLIAAPVAIGGISPGWKTSRPA